MSERSLIFTADGKVRAPWRIVVFLATTLVCVAVAQIILVPGVAWVFALAGIRVTGQSWSLLVGLLGAHVITLRYWDRLPWSYVSLGRDAAHPATLANGFAIGALAIAVPIALLVALGWMGRTAGADGSWAAAALRVSIFLLPAALTEELFVRGYVFAVLRRAIGWRWTLAATSVVFGLLHLRNNGASVQSVGMVTLAGVLLGAVLLATRSLYAAWMAHFAWNWTLAVAFHAAVSGMSFDAPDYRFVDAGPDWATGGVWGPEGGAAAGLGMLAALGYLYARRSLRRREDT